jgi:hypothetical protein
MLEAGLWPASTLRPTVSKRTVYRALLQQGLRNFRSERRLKITKPVSIIRKKYSEEWQDFNYKRVTVKFSDECSVARGLGRNQEWSF